MGWHCAGPIQVEPQDGQMSIPQTQPRTTRPITTESAEQRLGRLAEACWQGQMAGATLELHAWRREPDCPAEAVLLLASLLARQDRWDDARAVLVTPLANPAGREAAQPQRLEMLISVLVRLDMLDTARHLAAQLYRDFGHDAQVMTWLAATDMPGTSELTGANPALIEQLALDLVRRPNVVPSLVAAQKISFDAESASLLRTALNRAARDMEQDGHAEMLCRAMAELSMMLGDEDEARRWAHRGLKANPYAAPLALVLAKVADDPAVGPAATHVLAQACHEHPTYPDLRAAWIRRDHQDGKVHVAKHRLKLWLAQTPNHPVAVRLKQELAA
ncbi:MAG: hypothetical protein IT440_00155 [Phycisphaeraceae bacterium]|nr:hypothetical protein [Phycisphaeraceae bacterium]